MFSFRLAPHAGTHAGKDSDGNDVIYGQGDIIETEVDLTKVFPGKFVKIQVRSEEDAPVPQKKSTKKKPAKKEATSSLGRDVTDTFPTAKKEDFKVFQDGGAFFVCEPDAIEDPLHPKPLKKKDVESFVEEYLQD